MNNTEINQNLTSEENLRQIEHFFSQNRRQEALNKVDNLLEKTSPAKNSKEEWLHLYLKALVPFSQNNYKKSLLPLNKSLQTAVDNNLLYQEAKSQSKLGEIAYNLKDYKDALELNKRAYSLFQALKKKEMLDAQVTMIRTLIALDKLEEAEKELKQATKTAKQLQDFKSLAGILEVQGLVQQRNGMYKKALKSLRDSIDLFKDFNDKTHIYRSYLRLVKVLTEKGDYVQALEILAQAKNIIEEIEKHSKLVEVYNIQGWCHYALEDYEGAMRHFHEAVTNYLGHTDIDNVKLAKTQQGILLGHIKKHEFTVVWKKIEELENLNKRLSLQQINSIIRELKGIYFFTKEKYTKASPYFSDDRIEAEEHIKTKIRLLLYQFWLQLKARSAVSQEKPDNEPPVKLRELAEQISILVSQDNLYPLSILITSLRGLIQAYELKHQKGKEKIQNALRMATNYSIKYPIQLDKERKKVIDRAILDSISFSMFDKSAVVEYQNRLVKELERILETSILLTYLLEVAE